MIKPLCEDCYFKFTRPMRDNITYIGHILPQTPDTPGDTCSVCGEFRLVVALLSVPGVDSHPPEGGTAGPKGS